MELYLDSANLSEIETFFQAPFLRGLTTTPTFMHREGVKDVDAMIVHLSKLVPILQIEALGKTADEIWQEAQRQIQLGLDPQKTVFKIPVSWEGLHACQKMIQAGYMVNIHLIYTLQQAYMAMNAGATYVCPLVGRLQDQGHNAIDLVADCVETVDRYSYDTKVMFSSVRNVEHVRNALQVGAHAITVPGKIMRGLTENHFTSLGTKEFFEHTNLIKICVGDILAHKPKISMDQKIVTGLVEMTRSQLGAVAVVDSAGKVVGVFTDGDLRRLIETDGHQGLEKTFAQLVSKQPVTLSTQATLEEAKKLFQEKKIDTLVVADDGYYQGMLDVQELLAAITQ